MIPCVGVVIQGEKYFPLMNNRAMFRLQEEFPPDIIDKISNDDTKAGFKLAFEIFSVLCEEGEAVRRHYGYETGMVPNWEEAEITYLPSDILALKNAVFAAISIGYGQELDLHDEVDIWLVELEKKTAKSPGE